MDWVTSAFRQNAGCYIVFEWREGKQLERKGHIVWAPFPEDTDYFDPSRALFMINYWVGESRSASGTTSAGRSDGARSD